MSAITLRAPRRLASIAERMLASSELVSAANTSVLSMFSSMSSSSSAASPCSTMAFSSSSEMRRARARVALDELHLVVLLQRLREAEADVAAAGDDDAPHRIFVFAHLAHDAADVVARGEEEHLIAVFDDRVAVGRDAAAVAVDRHDARLDLRQVLAQLAQLLADEQAAARARARPPGAPCRRRNRAPAACPG